MLIIDMGQNNSRYGAFLFFIPEKGTGKKKRKIFVQGKIFFWRRRKRRNYFFLRRRLKMEKEKEENIWKRIFFVEEKRTEKENEKNVRRKGKDFL